MGSIQSIDGGVRETTRPYYEMIDREAEGENYRLSDLGLDKKLTVGGMEMDCSGRFLRLGVGMFYLNPRSRAEAIRDYYIGLTDKIEYEGKEYEYMMIPAGDWFRADLDGALIDLELDITPFSLRARDMFEFAPWLGVGLMGFGGHYDLDAGPARGSTVYEYPSREYVIGGRSSGWGGMGIPALGIGAEITIGDSSGPRLLVRAGWHFLHYHGDTRYLPLQIRHHKDLALDFDHFRGEASLEFPISRRVDLFFGLGWRKVKAEAEAKAIPRSEEEIDRLREKFDKEIDFNLSFLTGFCGIRF